MAKDYARPFYDSSAWRTTQRAYMESQNYICEEYGGAACIVHHIKHISPENVGDTSITLDWQNLKALCYKCHTEAHGEDQRYRDKAARLNGIAFDKSGNVIKQANVFLVCGSPASGKTTYVMEHKGECDLVVDLDYICAALMLEAGGVHTDHKPIIAVALEVRTLLYDIIKTRRGKWERAFVITGISNAQEIRMLAHELKAEVVTMETPLSECLKRIRNDPSRSRSRRLYSKLAAEWHDNYKKSLQSGVIPPTF
jgi:predicted kinase